MQKHGTRFVHQARTIERTIIRGLNNGGLP